MPFLSNKLICDTALSKVGKLDYKFGGNNIEGGYGDCSDYTEWVYSCYGVDIGGNTDSQYNQGTPVSLDDAQPADLVFFANTYKSGYTDGVSHVGIYLGDNKFVHLGNSGCRISNLNDRYYSNHLLGFRHVTAVNAEVDNITDDMIDNTNAAHDQSEQLQNDAFWWGDIVRIVIIVIMVIVAVALLAGAVGVNIIKGVK